MPVCIAKFFSKSCQKLIFSCPAFVGENGPAIPSRESEKKAVFSLNYCGGANYMAFIAPQKSGQLRRNRGKSKNGRGNSLEIGAELKTIGASP